MALGATLDPIYNTMAKARSAVPCSHCGVPMVGSDHCHRCRAACKRRPTVTRLAEMIAAEPGLTRAEIARRVGFGERQMQFYINDLREATWLRVVLEARTGGEDLKRGAGYRFKPAEFAARVVVDPCPAATTKED